jgi:hypothetical protein
MQKVPPGDDPRSDAISFRDGKNSQEALNAAMATATRLLQEQVREAENNLQSFRLSGISHAHTLTTSSDGATHAVVTAIASYEYR